LILQQSSNAESSMARWMTLAEALEYIQSAEKCGSVSAQVQLKQKIGRGVVPVKWADTKGPRDIPNVRVLARSQLVLSRPGLASGNGFLRPLLVLRQAVFSTWPRSGSGTVAAPESVKIPKSGLTGDGWEEREGKDCEQWMTLVEAVEHIRMLDDDCGSVEVLRQLKGEIGDGQVRVRWADSKGPNDRPQHKPLSGSQLLLVGTGIAPDEEEGTYRPLLVDRFDIQKLWPLRSDVDTPTGHSGSSDQIPTPRRSLATDEEILAVARKLYQQAGNDPPNQTKAERIIAGLLPGTKRESIRPVLQRLEFQDVRRKPGRQPQYLKPRRQPGG
jgi:hypothetical protein